MAWSRVWGCGGQLPAYTSTGTIWSFFFTITATTKISTLSLHDALPICDGEPRHAVAAARLRRARRYRRTLRFRSEEHTSELQSRLHLVCRLLLEKKRLELRRSARRVHVDRPSLVDALHDRVAVAHAAPR